MLLAEHEKHLREEHIRFLTAQVEAILDAARLPDGTCNMEMIEQLRQPLPRLGSRRHNLFTRVHLWPITERVYYNWGQPDHYHVDETHYHGNFDIHELGPEYDDSVQSFWRSKVVARCEFKCIKPTDV